MAEKYKISLRKYCLLAIGGALGVFSLLMHSNRKELREITFSSFIDENSIICILALIIGAIINVLIPYLIVRFIKNEKLVKRSVFLFALVSIYAFYPLFINIEGVILWFVFLHLLLFWFYDELININSNYIKLESWNGLIYSFLFVNYFTIIPTIYAYSIGSIQLEQSVLEGFFCSSVLLVPLVFFPKISKVYLLIWSPLLLVSSLILIFYMYVFGSPISQSDFFIILETNFNEASEFTQNYFSIGVFVVLISFLVIPAYIFYKLSKTEFSNKFKPFKVKIALTTLFLFFSFVDDSYQFNPIYSHVSKIVRYKKQFDDFRTQIEFRKDNISSFKDIESSVDSEEEETYVIIIGESTTRNHMSLYGYPRKTNPLLEKITNLYTFNDVLSPAASTLASLKKVLTFANLEDMSSLNTKGSVVEFFNEANFETSWVSNQQFSGRWETFVSVVANMSDNSYFLNDPTIRAEESYDEKVLPNVEKLLNSKKSKKKFIVVHLLGTHASYKKRYPSNYQQFNDRVGVVSIIANTPAKFDIINSYDNAILYNDYIVSEIIEKVKKQNELSYVLYFSDHGDEVFDKVDFFGHSGGKHSNQMYEIPFLLWVSDKYKQQKSNVITEIDNSKSKKYQIDDVIHTIIDLSSMKCTDFEPEKSIVNQAFEPRKRILGDSEIDYDE